MSEISDRRIYTASRIVELRKHLKAADELISGRVCVYATGSFGRREASKYSDLDLFIVGKSTVGKDGEKISLLSRLSDICVKAELIATTRRVGIPDFDGDGKYLTHQPVHLFTETLGKPEDDAINTFTARLLLLLESYPLIGEDIYKEVINDLLAAYWGDYEDHKDGFMPAFLANDILRLWRTFCVNYEARTERQPTAKKIKRKIKNYKLKFSRLLTCYSALLYLLSLYRDNGTVPPADVVEISGLSPTERLEKLRKKKYTREISRCLEDLLRQYDNFLKMTDAPESVLVEKFSDKDTERKCFVDAGKFGTRMFDAMELIGEKSKLHRIMVV
jgi:hypothetical protein